MKPPCLPSLFALLLAAALAVMPSSLHADTSSPVYGGSLYIHGETYDWVSASEDGTYRYDEYSGPNGSVTVTGMSGFPNLASVSGSSGYGTVDGHLDSGTYGDNYWENGTPGYPGTWERTQYTVNLAVGELYWLYETGSNDGWGNESSSWNDSNGQWESWSRSFYDDYSGNQSWSESWDGSASGPGWRQGGSAVEQTPSGGLYLFGQSFDLTGRNNWWETGSDGADNGGESCSYSSVDGSFSINSSYDNLTLTGHTRIEGTDPDVGSFEAEFPAWFTGQGMLDGVVWDARSGESFGPSEFWVDGWLVTWQGGTLSSDGTVVDTYAGELFTVTLTGPAREFALGNAPASLAVNGAAGGTVDLNGTWNLDGWTVSTSEPQQTSTTEPFFLPAALSLYVNGAEYVFEASFTDAGGGRGDVYRNAALGRLALNGQTAGTANVVGHSGSDFFKGSLTGGVFGATLPVAVEVSASPPVVVFEPVPLWVRGVFYGTRVLDVDQMPTNTFTNAVSDPAERVSITFTEGANPGEWDVAGADAAGQPTFSRTLTSLPTGVFMVTGPQGESLPALVVANNGEFQGIGGTEAETTALVAAGMPLAVAVETANLEYLGTAADDAAPGQQVAWYARREAAHATRLLKIAQGGSGVAAVTLTDYAAGTVMAGSYHPQSYLFQTAPPVAGATTASLPAPFYSADTEHNYTRLLLARPDPSLPPSFVVRGKSWWYAGADAAGNALYQGFYNNQLMTLGAADAAGQRLVTLSDPTHNNGTATSGTLSSERKSVRLRDGTLVLSGTEQGSQAVVQHVDQHKLHTIAADLDLLGNNLSFGILQGDASLAGALFQFSDQGGTASLHSILSRPQAQWGWWKAEGLDGDTLRPVMWLGSDHRLNLYKPGAYDAPAIVLDPAGTSSFQGPVRVPMSGDIPMGIYQEGDPP